MNKQERQRQAEKGRLGGLATAKKGKDYMSKIGAAGAKKRWSINKEE